MFWQDVLVDHVVNRQTLVTALSKILDVPETHVKVVCDLEEITSHPVSCHMQLKGGHFPLVLSIYVVTAVAPDPVAGARALGRLLGTRLLIDADTPNPYIMRLIEGDTVREVSVDVRALDERDEYVLAQNHA